MNHISIVKKIFLVGMLIMITIHGAHAAQNQEAFTAQTQNVTKYVTISLFSAATLPVLFKYVRNKPLKYILGACLTGAALFSGYNSIQAAQALSRLSADLSGTAISGLQQQVEDLQSQIEHKEKTAEFFRNEHANLSAENNKTNNLLKECKSKVISSYSVAK
jgi:peptidoglycan hydrolase CwlO-like protein